MAWPMESTVRSEPQPWQRVAAHGGLAVLLIRHGRTDFNATHRFCGGRSDPPLDTSGREQAEALGSRLSGHIDALFCSPQLRARETAAVLGEAIVIEDLRELDQGALEGRDIQPALVEHAEFFRAWKRDPTHVPVPGGGESMGMLADRVVPAVDAIVAGFEARRGRVIAIVSHQMTQAAFVCRALGRPLRDWPQFQLRNATANLLAWDRGRWALAERNL